MPESNHLSDLDLDALLDGALGAAAARQATAHLSACRGCARRVEARRSLFLAIESWGEVRPSHDLTAGVVQALTTPATPVGLRVVTAVQAGLAILIVALAWPLVASLWGSLVPPPTAAFDLGLSQALPSLARDVTLAAETAWHGLSGIAAAWLDLSSPWAALGPAIAAGALLLALFGNSMLLTGDRNGLRRSRARRL